MVLWAIALICLVAGVRVPGMDAQLAFGTCVAALVLGNVGVIYMRRTPREPQE